MLSKQDRTTLEAGLVFLQKAQNASDLWHYDIKTVPTNKQHDLSNTQYALLGLRAAMDCGLKVPADIWRDAMFRDGHFELGYRPRGRIPPEGDLRNVEPIS